MPENLILGVVAWVINTLFLLSLTLIALRIFASGSPSMDAIAFVFFGVFFISLFTFLVGKAGLLRPFAILLISAAGLISVLVLPRPRAKLMGGLSRLLTAFESVPQLWLELPTWLRILFVGFGVLSAARFLFLIWALPPFVWDSLTYHLTNVAHWIQAGRIEIFETSMARIYTPANYELLATWFAVFLHHDVVIEAAGLQVYALALLSIYASARLLGATRTGSLLGSVALGSLPGLLLTVTGTKNDGHMAAYFLASLAIGLHWVNGWRTRQGWELPGIALGVLILLLAAGTKAYIAHIFPGLLAIAVISMRRGDRLNGWKELGARAARQFRAAGWPAQLILILLLASGLILGGYWNFRNWIKTGNPFYPYGVSVQGVQVIPEGDRGAGFSLDRLRENLALVYERFGDSLAPIQPDLPDSTGWGWFSYVLGIPSLIWASMRKRRFRLIFIGFALSFLLLMMSTRPSPFNMRYAVWFPAIFSLSFALLWDASRKAQPAFLAVFSLCVLLNMIMMLNYGRIRLDRFDFMIGRSVWERHTSALGSIIPEEYQNALEIVPEGVRLGYNVHSNGFIYPLYRADFNQELVYVPILPGDSCQEIASRLDHAQTRYLFVAPEHSFDSNIAILKGCAGEGALIRERARGLYVIKRDN